MNTKIKYIPAYNRYIRISNNIIKYDNKSIGMQFNADEAYRRFNNKLIKIDAEIKSYGAFFINENIYNLVVSKLFKSEEEYLNIHKTFDFKRDIRDLNKYPYIWDIVTFCNIFDFDPITFGIFENIKKGFWYERKN